MRAFPSQSCPFPARLVLIGDVRTRDAARRILELVEGGAVLVCCRTMPDDWSAFRDAADAAGLRPAFRAALERGKIVDARAHGWQKALADAQSVRWVPASANLSFQHRRVPGGEIYLLTTEKGEPKKGSGPFSRNGPEGASQKRVLTPFSVRSTANVPTPKSRRQERGSTPTPQVPAFFRERFFQWER